MTDSLAPAVVAPLAGAWIEIKETGEVAIKNFVAPLAGAWIEIDDNDVRIQIEGVAPLAGAWIEIFFAHL